MNIEKKLIVIYSKEKHCNLPDRSKLVEFSWFFDAPVSYIQDCHELKKSFFLELKFDRWECQNLWNEYAFDDVWLYFDFEHAHHFNGTRKITISMEGPNYPIDQRAFLRACYFLASSLEGIIVEGENIRMSPEEFATKYEAIMNSPLDLSPPNWLPKRSE